MDSAEEDVLSVRDVMGLDRIMSVSASLYKKEEYEYK